VSPGARKLSGGVCIPQTHTARSGNRTLHRFRKGLFCAKCLCLAQCQPCQGASSRVSDEPMDGIIRAIRLVCMRGDDELATEWASYASACFGWLAWRVGLADDLRNICLCKCRTQATAMTVAYWFRCLRSERAKGHRRRKAKGKTLNSRIRHPFMSRGSRTALTVQKLNPVQVLIHSGQVRLPLARKPSEHQASRPMTSILVSPSFCPCCYSESTIHKSTGLFRFAFRTTNECKRLVRFLFCFDLSNSHSLFSPF
jgi:hypothetical protein